MTNPAAIFGADNAATLLQNTLVTQDGQELTSGRSRNFIRNRSGFRNTNGWVATGTATVTRTTTPSEVVDGVASLKFAAGAVNDTVKYAFTINNAQKNGAVSILFDYIVQSGNLGDFLVEIYDVTAAALIYSSNGSFAGSGTFSGYFLAGANTDYELRLTRKAGSGTFSAANFDVYKGQRPAVSSDTSWVAFTPVFENLGTCTAFECYKRKDGPDLLLDLRFTTGSVNSGFNAAIFLPDSLIIGSSAGSGHTCGTFERNSATNGFFKGGIMIAASGFAKIFFGQKETASAVSPFTPQDAGNFVSGQIHSVQVRVPISGWELSTYSANNALIEYGGNTSTTDADDTTSFVNANGINGQLIPTITPALGSPFNRSKTIQWQNAKTPLDRFFIQIQAGGVGDWISLENCDLYQSQKVDANTGNRWGICLSSNTSSNQTIIQFGRAGSINAAWAGGVGTGYPRNAGDRYRVVKVSPGGDVLLPIGARNIFGDTTGTPAPTGYPGETIFSNTYSSGVITADLGITTACTLVVPPGNWIIRAAMSDINSNGAANGTVGRSGFVVTNAPAQNWEAYSSLAEDIAIGSGIWNNSLAHINHMTGVAFINVPVTTTYYLSLRTTGHSAPNTYQVFAKFVAKRFF
jgi:hypothetical protein